MPYDYLFKFIVVGDSSVGKSCLLKKFIEDRFDPLYDTTIGVEFGAKIIKIRNKNIKLHIWDTAGQEYFRCITRTYYRGSAGIILIYDISRRETFDNLQDWLKEIKMNVISELPIFLVANKTDLISTRQVNKEEGEKFAKDNNLLFKEISIKNQNIENQSIENQSIENQNIENQNIFYILANDILTNIETNKIRADINNGIKVGSHQYEEINLKKKYKGKDNETCC